MADAQPAPVARLTVKVVAGASRSEIAGWSNGRLRVRISAVAERGKANAALVRLLADRLGVAGSSLSIVAGKTSALKTLVVTGLSEAEMLERLPSR